MKKKKKKEEEAKLPSNTRVHCIKIMCRVCVMRVISQPNQEIKRNYKPKNRRQYSIENIII